MSVSETAKRPEHRGRSIGLWLAFFLVIAAGVGIAWLGTSPLRGETTTSGLRIRTVTKGEGPFVQPLDGVLVEYEGRLADGTVFDDSARHGGPQPMIAGQVIKGFAEALTKMQKGGKYKIHIPGALPMARTRRREARSARTPTSISTSTSCRSCRNAALMQQQGGQPAVSAGWRNPGRSAAAGSAAGNRADPLRRGSPPPSAPSPSSAAGRG